MKDAPIYIIGKPTNNDKGNGTWLTVQNGKLSTFLKAGNMIIPIGKGGKK